MGMVSHVGLPRRLVVVHHHGGHVNCEPEPVPYAQSCQLLPGEFLVKTGSTQVVYCYHQITQMWMTKSHSSLAPYSSPTSLHEMYISDNLALIVAHHRVCSDLLEVM